MLATRAATVSGVGTNDTGRARAASTARDSPVSSASSGRRRVPSGWSAGGPWTGSTIDTPELGPDVVARQVHEVGDELVEDVEVVAVAQLDPHRVDAVRAPRVAGTATA